MIQAVCLLSWIAIWTFIAAFLAGLIGLITRSENLAHRLSIRPWARLLLFSARIRVNVKGLEHVDPQSPCVFMPNHQSNFDIPILLSTLNTQFHFLAKKELFKIPIFGWGMKHAGYIAIERSNSRSGVKSFLEAAEKIKNGKSVVIFPEGTRSADGKIGEFKKGGFSLAIAAKVPVYPIVIRGAWEIMSRKALRIQSGKVDVIVLPPIFTTEMNRKDAELLQGKVYTQINDEFNNAKIFT